MSRMPGGKEWGYLFCGGAAIFWLLVLALVAALVTGLYHLATWATSPAEVAPVTSAAR